MNDVEKTPEYFSWIVELKKRYRSTQIKAAVSVNTALLEFYWSLGKDISERYLAEASYGTAFFKELSADLKIAIPEASGLSPRNLAYCRDFFCLYSSSSILPQVAAKSPKPSASLPQVAANYRQQFVDDGGAAPQFLEQLLVQVPWGHHRIIIDKCRGDVSKALFYVRKTMENGWSRNVLAIEIDGDLYSLGRSFIAQSRRERREVASSSASWVPHGGKSLGKAA